MPLSTPRSDRTLFTLAGFWFLALTLVGFSHSFYFRPPSEPMPVHLIVHGVLFTAWVAVFFTQTALIAAHQIRWHRTVGWLALVLLVFMLPVGYQVVLVKAAAGNKSIAEAGFNLTGLTLGFVFALYGLAMRKRPFVHKRMMLFATLSFTVAAADRVAALFQFDDFRIARKLLAVLPAIALVGYDALVLRIRPWLSAVLLTIVWAVIWYVVSDIVFEREIGEALIRELISIFVR